MDIDNVHIATIGNAKDGGDYFVAAFAAPTNSLVVRNSYLGGLRSNAMFTELIFERIPWEAPSFRTVFSLS